MKIANKVAPVTEAEWNAYYVEHDMEILDLFDLFDYCGQSGNSRNLS